MSDRPRPRLVFAACRPPYPLENGARIRTYQLLTGLARSFDIVFVTFEHHPDSPDGPFPRVQIEQLLPDVEVVTVPGAGPGKRAGQAASLLRHGSWTLGRYRTPAFTAALGHTVASHRPSIVHFDDPGVALAAPFADTVNVYCAHNVEQAILRLEARRGSPMRRLFNAVEACKVTREEQRIWRRVDLCLAVSSLDGAVMKAGGARRIELCPNGVDPVDRLPLRPLRPDEPLRLLFVGSGSYAPYERGLAWLVREVLPRVRAEVSVAFDVVGAPPVRPVAGDGVRYIGRVPTVKSYYEAAHVVVIPVFEGSGTRLKIIEAAAYGRPVVSTRLGAEGLPLEADVHFLQADVADDFAAAVLALDHWWREPTSASLDRMISDAREAILPLIWPRVVEQLAALYRSELERQALTEAGGADAGGITSLPDHSRGGPA
jgi:glycosyltransferase involved in cell wall biosynthesis